ncbi:unnamed protein product [Brugia timori]|uniref:Uncharacterized protein n=2 Tax=Brugia TaxID=6278 RepID=A8PK93_BRUMA|nr:unnamed protein product [Brugia timori]
MVHVEKDDRNCTLQVSKGYLMQNILWKEGFRFECYSTNGVIKVAEVGVNFMKKKIPSCHTNCL